MGSPSAMLGAMTEAARTAGLGLMARFRSRSDLKVVAKGQADFVSLADMESERVLRTILLDAHPGYGFVSEESEAVEGREAARFIVDPLDGTTNFLSGIPHFAVAIALERNGHVVAGVVYDPAKDEMFSGEKGSGAWLHGAPLGVSPDVDFSRAVIGTGIPHANAEHRHQAYLAQLEALMRRAAGIRRFGAAALDLAYVASGRVAAFFEFGLAPWDLAAGALLVREAGGHVTTPTGGDDFLESGDILATNGLLHDSMLSLLANRPMPP
jgi:myo-inositol-1(or 4)-monophosphatase